MPIVKMTKNYLHDYVMTLFLANNKRPDPNTGDPTKPVILMGGGSRSGKTVTIAQIILRFMEAYADPTAKNKKKLYIIVYRNTSVDSRKTFKDFIEEYDRIGLLPIEQRRNEKTGKIEMSGDYEKVESPKPLIRYKGHTVEFMGMPEGNQEAVGCDIAFINEILENNNEHAFYSIVRRTTLMTLADWNPKQSVHYIYNIKRFNFHYPVTTYLDNKWLPLGQKADAETQCPWEFEDSVLEVEISDIYGNLKRYKVPDGFTLDKWYAGYYQSDEAKEKGEHFDGFLRRRWLKPERPENCKEEDYHLYRMPNKLNYENGTVNRSEWLTYGEGIPSGQEGAIFNNVKWVDKFPESVDNQYFGLDYGFSCFDGNTQVFTNLGEKPIKDIRVGEYVLTSDGYREVLKHNKNGVKKLYEIKFDFDFGYRKISCTFDHKFKTTNGWKQLKDLTNTDVLYMNAFTMEKDMCEDHIQSTRTTSTPQALKKFFTGRFGKMLTEKYRMGSISIILMAILATTKLKTLCSLLVLSMQKYMDILIDSRQVLEIQRIATQKRTGLHEEKRHSKNLGTKSEIANGVELNIYQQIRTKGFAAESAIMYGSTKALKMTIRIFALFVQVLSKGISTLNRKLAQKSVHTPLVAKIEQITVLNEYYDQVYDLTVDKVHEYFANGILVHNCDPSALTSVGNIGMDMYIEKLCYQKTGTSELLFDLIRKPILNEEKRRYVEANGQEWYSKLLDLRSKLTLSYAKSYIDDEQRHNAIDNAKDALQEHINNGLPIAPIYIVTDTADVYKGRGAAVEQQFTLDLNLLAQQHGFNWKFIKVGSKPIVPRIALMKKFNLHLVKDKDFEIEQQNYCYAKGEDGKPTNIPDKDSKWNHIWDSAGYAIWKFFRFTFGS